MSETIPIKLQTRRTRAVPLHLSLLPRREAICNHLREYGIWQRPLTVFADWYLRPGDLVIDAGAHIGYFSVVFADAVGPAGEVHAFEPDPETFNFLERNRVLNEFENLKCYRLALSMEAGVAVLHRHAGRRWGTSLLARPGFDAKEQVETTCLDEILPSGCRPALVKIDVEGAELQVLKGMERILAESAPAIVLEFGPMAMEAADPELALLRNLIERVGYEVRPFIVHEGPSVIPPSMSFGTLAGIHNDYVKQRSTSEFDVLLVKPEALAGRR